MMRRRSVSKVQVGSRLLARVVEIQFLWFKYKTRVAVLLS